jgi:uncharacterized membrane protein YhaH (DUF805 family)
VSTTPAGWYPDPNQPGTQRYWDGANWTQQTQSSSFNSAALTSSDPFATVGGNNFGSTFSGDYGASSNSVRAVSFGEAIKRGFNRYTRWSGRATRSEYWFWTLFWALLYAVTFTLDLAGGLGIFSGVLVVVMFLPSLAVLVRRLHDTNKSAHFLWLFLVPIGGSIALLVFTLIPSESGTNRYGNPGD